MAWLRASGGGCNTPDPNIKYLYKDGDEFTDTTGGFERSTCWWNTVSSYSNTGSLTKNTTNMVLVTGNGTSVGAPATAFKSVNPVNVRGYSTLKVEGIRNGTTFIDSVDISSVEGALYVGFAVRGYSTACSRHFGITSNMGSQGEWIKTDTNLGTGGSYPKLTHTIFAIWLEK